MNEMTLPSRHRIQNLNPGGPSKSTSRRLPTIARKKYLVSLKPECQSDGRNPRSPTFQAETALTTAPVNPQLCDIEAEEQS